MIPASSVGPRILVLCRPYLGDQILSGPVFRNLRAWQPDAWIAAGVYPESAAPLAFFPEIDEVIHVPRRAERGRVHHVRDWIALLRRLRRERFDLVYDLMHTDRSSLATLATAAPFRVGFIPDRHRMRHRVYSHAAVWRPYREHTHTADLFLRSLEELGMPVRTRSIAVEVPAEAARAAAEHLRNVLPGRSGPLVPVHPGAGTPNRLWPAERFAAVCDDLQANLGAHVLLLGASPLDPGVRAIRSAMRTSPILLERPVGIGELAALLREASVFLGLDSGPAHLAAAVGTPAVVIFGAALPAQWAPLGEGHVVV
nr:glycosyltransferase family 9 protein [Chloroflexota bacterium]